MKKIQKYCYKIILFGSRADGSNIDASDIDLFIITEYKKEVRKIVAEYETMDIKYQVVLQDLLESASSKKEDSVFHKQVEKGIILWKGKPTYESI